MPCGTGIKTKRFFIIYKNNRILAVRKQYLFQPFIQFI